MPKIHNFQDLFKRYRRPGDLLFALLFVAVALFLIISFPTQTAWVKKTRLFAQPAFWPGVAIGVMVVFGALHLLGSLVSDRIPGRLKEVWYWARAFEFAAWFMIYVSAVPVLGYLPSTLIFCIALTLRLGYRGPKWVLISGSFATGVVVVFKSFLQVKIPGGLIYEYLPTALRSFMLTYL